MRQSRDPGTYEFISNLVFERKEASGGVEPDDVDGAEMMDTRQTAYGQP